MTCMNCFYLDDGMITFDLIIRSEGMDVAILRPRERDHTAGAVELHRAAAKWDHSVGETEIFGSQVIDVAQHLGFGVVLVEDGMRQVGSRPSQFLGNDGLLRFSKVSQGDRTCRSSRSKDIDEGNQILRSDALVKSRTNMLIIDPTQVDTSGNGLVMKQLCVGQYGSNVDGDGVKE